MNILIFFLAVAASALAFALYESHRDLAAARQLLRHTEAALAESEEHRDAVKRSALRGAPAVLWTKRIPSTGRVHRYWRMRHDGRDALISELAMTNAKRLADLILPDEPEVTASTAAKSEARPGGEPV